MKENLKMNTHTHTHIQHKWMNEPTNGSKTDRGKYSEDKAEENYHSKAVVITQRFRWREGKSHAKI